ncbi:hypothetical protein ACFQMB_04225 [Pseudobowmanella zhangzhouensis]|uniref:hypothetical protein n=1 Tax=Pseudobowmanella zhangzhouensis TaxID=1537679 RepID=UPI00360C0D5C
MILTARSGNLAAMQKITPYQQAVLTELGIPVWSIRDDAPAHIREAGSIVAMPESATANEVQAPELLVQAPEQLVHAAPVALAKSADPASGIAALKQAMGMGEPVQTQPAPAREEALPEPVAEEFTPAVQAQAVTELPNLFESSDVFVNDVKCALPHDPALIWNEGEQFAVNGNTLVTLARCYNSSTAPT